MDGRGSWEATTIWHGDSGRLYPVLMIPFPNSLGHFYSEFTEFLGFQRNSDEWKVMGLAPYGKPVVDLSAFIDVRTLPYRASPYRIQTWLLITNGWTPSACMVALLCLPRITGRDVYDLHLNVV